MRSRSLFTPLHFQSNKSSRQLFRTHRRASRGQTLHLVSPLFCIRLGEHFICVPLPLPLPLLTPKAEQSRISTVSFILLRALLYTTPTPLTPHNPITLNPHLYLFIDHPTSLFCHANPCIGICLIALSTVGCFGWTRRDIPQCLRYEFDARKSGAFHSRSPLFPHAVSSCGFVGVVCAVTLCNYCCKSHRFKT